MPFKYYHGKTGRVWNVTKRAVGVEMNKKVGGRIIKKRLHVRIEHVRPSRCREEFLLRRERNDKLKKDAKDRGGELMKVVVNDNAIQNDFLLFFFAIIF